jgi:dTDP-4-amino-4,6-dideoxygalactose transaminase
MDTPVSRRRFLGAAVAGSAAVAAPAGAKLAITGGKPVRTAPFPTWPKVGAVDEKAVLEVLRSGRWFRGWGKQVEKFEAAYARLTGAAHCLATANGTSALYTSLNAVGVGPGDEVIVPPYTFVATVNVVLLQHAVPVFVDTDPETFQMDARRLEAAITDHTRAIVPVHLGGNAADLDAILPIAARHKIPVIEDACQAHLGEWRGKKVGTLGATGCFSFQNSKNLNSGEGGAILTASDELMERCYSFHNNGRARKAVSDGFSYAANGANLRLTEFQAAVLMAQMMRLEEQSKTREQNAGYLTTMLKEIPGIAPARHYEGCTRNAYHLYMFRYDREKFGGRPRSVFLKALEAEGIPASGGYDPLNREPFLKNVMASRAYKAVMPPERLQRWEERNQCPANDRLCGEAVWFTQTMLLGPRSDMDQIAEAVRKVQANVDQLPRS